MTTFEYEELRIRAWPIGNGRQFVLANGAFPATAVVRLPREPLEYRVAMEALLAEAFRQVVSASPLTAAERARSLGRELFATFFPDGVSRALLDTYGLTERRGLRLRLRFDLDGELRHVPLELLEAPEHSPLGSLAARGISIVRSLPWIAGQRRIPQASDKPAKLKLLVVVASPTDMASIEANDEIESIRALIGRLKVVELRLLGRNTADGAGLPTLTEVQRFCGNQQGPCAVLVLAHGAYDAQQRQPVVYLENENGTARAVPANVLANALVQASGLRLALLNLCRGAQAVPGEPFFGVAQALYALGVPAVVAMQYEVSVTGAAAFSPPFLKALLENKAVDDGVASGRAELLAQETAIEYATPCVYLDPRCGHGWIFKVTNQGRIPLEPTDFLNYEVVPGRSRKDYLSVNDTASAKLEELGPVEVIAALRHLRSCAQWERAAELARDLHMFSPEDLERQQLLLETELERVIDETARVCAALAADEPAEARERLQDLDGTLRSRLDGAAGELGETAIALLCAPLRQEIDDHEAHAALARAREFATRREWHAASELFRQVKKQRPADAGIDAALQHAEGRWHLGEGRFAAAATALRGVTSTDWPEATLHCRYAEARAAEDEGRWREAEVAYADLPTDVISDAKPRRLWAAARVALADRSWRDARRCFTQLCRCSDSPYDEGSVLERRRYATGRDAADRRHWILVVRAFGPLDDADFEGQIGRHRRHARARIARARGEWARVGEELREVPKDFLDAVRLRAYAQGRLCEAQGEWARAAALYATLDGDEDVALRGPYARARAAASAGDWAEAADVFAALAAEADLPAEFAVVRAHAPYAAGRLAEEREDWAAAGSAFEACGSFDDAPLRRCRALALLAEAAEDWRAMHDALAQEPTALDEEAARTDHMGLSTMRAYATAKQLESAGEFARAAEAYARSAGYRDAADRHVYTRGLVTESAGAWRVALALYERLPAGFAGVASRSARLRQLLDALPWVDEVLGTLLVADPWAARVGLSPYAALRAGGIGPDATMAAVQDASFALMENQALTPEAREAWDRLRSLPERLAVDAFLYPVQDDEALRVALADLEPGRPRELLDALVRQVPSDAPLLLLLGGRSDRALTAWDACLTEAPAEAAVAHAVAVAHLWRAREREVAGADEHAELSWRKAIACFGLVLGDDAYWEKWRRARAACYGQVVTQGDITRLRARVSRDLLSSLSRQADDHASAGRPERAETFRRLALELEVELEGQRLLAQDGANRLVIDRERTIACGLGYVRQMSLGLPLATLVRGVSERARQEEPDEVVDEPEPAAAASAESTSTGLDVAALLRCVFSDLAAAVILLDRQQPDEAIRALPVAWQRPLREVVAGCPGPVDGKWVDHLAGCKECEAWAWHNPAYLSLPRRAARYQMDAVALAVRAHLDAATTALVEARFADALARWRAAVDASRHVGTQVRTKRALARIVIGRSRALGRTVGPQRGEQLTHALDLLHEAHQLVGSAAHGLLAPTQAELLTDRGVWYGYGCHPWEAPDLEKAATDLRQAIALTPDSLLARDNLARALIFDATNKHQGGLTSAPFRLMAEALDVLLDSLRRLGSPRQLVKLLHDALDEIEEWALADLPADKLTERIANTAPGGGGAWSTASVELAVTAAITQLSSGDAAGAMMTLIPPARVVPGDARIWQTLKEALYRKAGDGAAPC